jgi:hypothetical protein
MPTQDAQAETSQEDRANAAAAAAAQAEERQQAQAERQAAYNAQPGVRVAKLIADLQKPHIGEDRMHVYQMSLLQLAQVVQEQLPEIEPLEEDHEGA